MWVFEKNESADRAAKEALEKEPIDDVMPFSDLKPLTAKYIHQVWHKEWDETVLVSNEFHEVVQNFQTNCYFYFYLFIYLFIFVFVL